jgi:hypothetical protein
MNFSLHRLMLTLQHSETSTETYMFAQISDEQIRQYHGTHGHMAEAHYQLVAILGANDNTQSSTEGKGSNLHYSKFPLLFP